LDGYDDWLQSDDCEQTRIVQYINDKGILSNRKRINVDVKKYLAVVLMCKHSLKPGVVAKLFKVDHSVVSFYAKSFLEINKDEEFRDTCREAIRLFPLDFKYAIVSLEKRYFNKRTVARLNRKVLFTRYSLDVLSAYMSKEDGNHFSRTLNRYIKEANEGMVRPSK
jgi:hypothetical protein